MLAVQINQGGDIPEKYYMTNLTETCRDEMERVVIGRGSTHKVRLDVDKSNSVIQWEFVSTQYDIAFGIYHKVLEERGKKGKNELVKIIQCVDMMFVGVAGKRETSSWAVCYKHTHTHTHSHQCLDCCAA